MTPHDALAWCRDQAERAAAITTHMAATATTMPMLHVFTAREIVLVALAQLPADPEKKDRLFQRVAETFLAPPAVCGYALVAEGWAVEQPTDDLPPSRSDRRFEVITVSAGVRTGVFATYGWRLERALDTGTTSRTFLFENNNTDPGAPRGDVFADLFGRLPAAQRYAPVQTIAQLREHTNEEESE